MRLATALCGAAVAIALAVPAQAFRLGYQADADVTLIEPITRINVTVDPDAINETLRLSRASTRNESYLGPNDAEDLVADLYDELVENLGSRGLLDETAAAGATLNVIILDADPNNLAFTEVGRHNFLDNASIGRGGAELEATLIASDGSVLANYGFDYSEPGSIRFEVRAGTWTEARRTFDRFARRLAEDLAE